jgi:hypothetical protein
MAQMLLQGQAQLVQLALEALEAQAWSGAFAGERHLSSGSLLKKLPRASGLSQIYGIILSK